jgi:hypothetical protein
MPDPRLYESDTYVLLEPNRPEQFLTTAELHDKLEAVLAQQEELPDELKRFSSLSEQATHLLETACEFDLGPGSFIQWYVVRLEK